VGLADGCRFAAPSFFLGQHRIRQSYAAQATIGGSAALVICRWKLNVRSIATKKYQDCDFHHGKAIDPALKFFYWNST
jgi:hypothetical protein